jgi:hypothetical protein
MFVVTNTFQPAFTGISSFFFVLDPRITLEEGLVNEPPDWSYEAAYWTEIAVRSE